MNIHAITALLTVGVIATAATASAQTSRVELGVHVSLLRLSEFETTTPGLGGRATFDVTRWLAIEGEVSAYPNDDYTIDNALPFVPEYEVTYRRSRVSGFFGPKAGLRGDRLGIFVTARPGFTRLKDGGVDCTGPGCPLILLAPPEYRTEFAFDVGGALEFYFPSGAMVRVDAADTIIGHRSLASPCASCTTHNFTTRIGIGVRF